MEKAGAAPPIDADLGFSYRATRQGEVHISRGGREATTLRGDAAAKFLGRAEGASFAAIQQLCARVTGNYKRGNESPASPKRNSR